MLDDDDADTFWLVALFTNGPLGILFVVLAIVVAVVVAKNHDECAAKTCPSGMKAQLANHMCACVMEAK
jgi:hypothetical protein